MRGSHRYQDGGCGGAGPRDGGAFGLGLVGSLIVDLPDLGDA
jgi:hypothetical protein